MFLPEPRHMPCPECGISVPRAERDQHVCTRDDLARYQVFHLRHELAAFEDEVAAYLASPHGRFALWDAEQRRLGRR